MPGLADWVARSHHTRRRSAGNLLEQPNPRHLRPRYFPAPSVPGFDCPETNEDYANARHRSLVFLAWMLEGWPDSYNAGVVKDLLAQWSEAKRTRVSRHLGDKWEDAWNPGPHQIESETQARIRQSAAR